MELFLMLLPPSLLLILSPLQLCQGSPGRCGGLISSSPLPSHSHRAVCATYTCTGRLQSCTASLAPSHPASCCTQPLTKSLPFGVNECGKWAILTVLSFQYRWKSFLDQLRLRFWAEGLFSYSIKKCRPGVALPEFRRVSAISQVKNVAGSKELWFTCGSTSKKKRYQIG